MINVLLLPHFTDDEAEAENLSQKTMVTQVANSRAKLQTQAVWLQGPHLPHSALLCSLDQKLPFLRYGHLLHLQQDGGQGFLPESSR